MNLTEALNIHLHVVLRPLKQKATTLQCDNIKRGVLLISSFFTFCFYSFTFDKYLTNEFHSYSQLSVQRVSVNLSKKINFYKYHSDLRTTVFPVECTYKEMALARLRWTDL